MKVVLGKDGNLDCIYIGETPDFYNDSSKKIVELHIQKTNQILKLNFNITKSNAEGVFFVDSEEFIIIVDDLMPITIYSKKESGNLVLQQIFIKLMNSTNI